MNKSHPLLQLQDCSFSHGKQKVLNKIDLTFSSGLTYGIIGPNGSGKSTLLDLLSADKSPDHGSCHYKDVPYTTLPKKALAKKIALVPQEFTMGFDYKVEDLVLMGRHPHIPRFSMATDTDLRHVHKAMEQLDIMHLRNRSATELSGGEKQRVMVARSLAQDCQVLLLDEATSNLDIQHTISIMRLIKDKTITENKLVITVVHDLNLAAAYCDKIVALYNGKIIAEGDTSITLTTELIKKLFNISAHVFQKDQGQISIDFSW